MKVRPSLRDWLLPNRHDPRNLACVSLAKWLAPAEIIVLVLLFAFPAAGSSATSSGIRIAWMVAFLAPIALLSVGVRAVISGDADRFAGEVLCWINAPLLVLAGYAFIRGVQEGHIEI